MVTYQKKHIIVCHCKAISLSYITVVPYTTYIWLPNTPWHLSWVATSVWVLTVNYINCLLKPCTWSSSSPWNLYTSNAPRTGVNMAVDGERVQMHQASSGSVNSWLCRSPMMTIQSNDWFLIFSTSSTAARLLPQKWPSKKLGSNTFKPLKIIIDFQDFGSIQCVSTFHFHTRTKTKKSRGVISS